MRRRYHGFCSTVLEDRDETVLGRKLEYSIARPRVTQCTQTCDELLYISMFGGSQSEEGISVRI